MQCDADSVGDAYLSGCIQSIQSSGGVWGEDSWNSRTPTWGSIGGKVPPRPGVGSQSASPDQRVVASVRLMKYPVDYEAHEAVLKIFHPFPVLSPVHCNFRLPPVHPSGHSPWISCSHSVIPDQPCVFPGNYSEMQVLGPWSRVRDIAV